MASFQRYPLLVSIVDEMTSWSVRAKANGVKCSAKFCFVFRMSCELPEFVHSMSKLALVAVFASSVLFEGST